MPLHSVPPQNVPRSISHTPPPIPPKSSSEMKSSQDITAIAPNNEYTDKKNHRAKRRSFSDVIRSLTAKNKP